MPGAPFRLAVGGGSLQGREGRRDGWRDGQSRAAWTEPRVDGAALQGQSAKWAEACGVDGALRR